ncbi:MAG: TlpA family protein disulfide reductase, partial [Bryobacteraceae bacterium]
LLYQSRAETALGGKNEAEQLVARSFAVYPSEEPAREWSAALEALGRDKDAIEKLADAFAIPDAHATDAERAADRKRLGEMYQKIHHSGKGLGDLILDAYDRSSAIVAERRERIDAMDPNSAANDPIQFTLSGLDGSKLKLASLKGDVVVLDFWATWCEPCRAQHPLYDQVKKKFENRPDVVFLSVDADQDHSLVSPFLDKQKWSRPVYFEDGLQKFLKVDSIPTTILFDKNGRVASRMNGYLPDKFVDQLTDRIQDALSQ